MSALGWLMISVALAIGLLSSIAFGLASFLRARSAKRIELRERRKLWFSDTAEEQRVRAELELLSRTRRQHDIPIGTEEFANFMLRWPRPTAGSTALALQTWVALGLEVPESWSGLVVDMVRKHYDRGASGFEGWPGGHSSVFGCWAALRIVRALAAVPYDKQASGFRPRLGLETAGYFLGRSRAEDVLQFVKNCHVAGKGYKERPSEGPLGPVTTDAAVTILLDLEGREESFDTELLRIAAYEEKHCIARLREDGETYLVARYYSDGPKEIEVPVRTDVPLDVDGRATRHFLSKYVEWFSHLPDFLQDDAQGFLRSFEKCSNNGTSSCPAYPGGQEVSLLDTHAWYEIPKLVLDPDDALRRRAPAALIELLERHQDASGGYGFDVDSHPNVFATRAAALIYRDLVTRNPDVEAHLQNVRFGIANFIESLRVPHEGGYVGVRHKRSNGHRPVAAGQGATTR